MKLINLNTKYLGRNFIFYKRIDSTQNEIFRMINNCKEQGTKLENGTLAMCDIQEKGKGTHGRKWITDEGGNIAFSMFVETNCLSSKLENITTKIARILVEIFREFYNISIDVKLPNDLYINGKKIGGILTEARVDLGSDVSEKVATTRYLVIGIGINTSKTSFDDEIKTIATSIKNEYEIDVDRLKIIGEFCNRFEKIIEKQMND